MNIEEIMKRIIAILKERIEKLKKAFLQEDSFQNEANISRQAVEPILRDLEWPTDDNNVVKYEYSLGAIRADIALFHEDKLKVIIEVKNQGSAEGAEKQLFQYAYHAGVELAVLTTGQEWEFYLPLKPGDYQDRQVYKLDISTRETEESASRLMRYLFYPDICTRKAIEMAEADHKDKARDRTIQNALPKAWSKVLSECDDNLVKILQDKVGDIRGFRPDSDVAKVFIRTQSEKTTTPDQPQKRIYPSVWEKRNRIKTTGAKKLQGFELHGRRHDARNGVTTLVAVFEELIKLDSSFPDRFMEIPHGRSRRWLASNQSELYPTSPDRCENSSRQISTEHWISTHYSRRNIEKIIEAACGVSQIDYRTDLKLLYR